MRDAFISQLTRHAEVDPRINLVVGDIGFGVVEEFAERFPMQFLNAGVAEQSMVGISAGMAAAGKQVFLYSIANFPTLRCLEQIRNDVCYHQLNVTVVSVGAGLAYGPLGYSHHAIEDISVLRALNGLTIYSPADAHEVRASVDQICKEQGPTYLRLGKNGEQLLHKIPLESNAMNSGAPLHLRTGNDLTLVATGAIADVALDVSVELLNKHGLSIRVLTLPRIKPLNFQALTLASAGTSAIVTLEEHVTAGGFGSAVLEAAAAAGVRTPILPIGIGNEAHRVVGSQDFLRLKSGLSVEKLVTRINEFYSQCQRGTSHKSSH